MVRSSVRMVGYDRGRKSVTDIREIHPNRWGYVSAVRIGRTLSLMLPGSRQANPDTNSVEIVTEDSK